MSRNARMLIEPLNDWPYPDVRLVPSPFFTTRDSKRVFVPWTTTADELLREADYLGARTVVVELDCTRDQLRQDGGVRSNARLRSGRVRVSMETRYGPMRWALARYDHAGLSWQANVRGIVLTLESLRAVERYGAVTDGQQYRGFLAIDSGPAPAPVDGGFDLATADGAVAWLVHAAERAGKADAYRASRGELLRFVAALKLNEDDQQRLAQVRRTLGGAGSAS